MPADTITLILFDLQNDAANPATAGGTPNKNNPANGKKGFSRLALSRSLSISSLKISAVPKNIAIILTSAIILIILNKFISFQIILEDKNGFIKVKKKKELVLMHFVIL